MSQESTKGKVTVPEDALGERIRARREEKHLTQEALSILTKYPQIDPEGRGLSRPSIVGYEQGKNLPDARGIRLLATALEVTPSWLVLGKYDDPALLEEDPRKSLIDALDRYTARREIELNPGGGLYATLRMVDQKLEGIDPFTRKNLEQRANEEARLETQKRNRPSS